MRRSTLHVLTHCLVGAVAASAFAQAAPAETTVTTDATPELPAAATPGDTPAPSKASSTTPTPSEAAVSDHAAQLLSFQQRIDLLTQRIEAAEARTKVLRTSALTGQVERTRATIVHRNLLGSGFTMVRASYIMDGRPIFDRDNADGRLDDDDPVQLFNGPIRAGPHELKVAIRVKGRAYGPFTYLEGYKFNLNSTYVFRVIEGRTNQLEIAASLEDDITQEPQDRLQISWKPTVVEPVESGAR